MKDRTIRQVLIAFALIATVSIGVAIFAVKNINRSVASSDWVNHTHAVILESQGLLATLRAGDAAVRTFFLTGDPRDQAAARAAFAAVSEHLEVLGALTRSEPAQNAQVVGLAPLVQTRSQLATDLASRRPTQAEAVSSLVAIDSGAASLAEIERRIEKLKSDQMALLAQQDTASYIQAQATRWTVWAGVALNFILLIGVGWLIRDDIEARRRAATVLETANRQLDLKVQERTAELVATNEQLANENLERKWANQALEHQLRYDQLIVNSIGDLVFVLTKVLNISRINPAVIELTGYDAPALIHRPISDIVRLTAVGVGGGPMVDPIAHALRSGHELRNASAVIKDRRGLETPVILTVCPLRDGNKVVGGVVIVEVQPTLPAPAASA